MKDLKWLMCNQSASCVSLQEDTWPHPEQLAIQLWGNLVGSYKTMYGNYIYCMYTLGFLHH